GGSSGEAEKRRNGVGERRGGTAAGSGERPSEEPLPSTPSAPLPPTWPRHSSPDRAAPWPVVGGRFGWWLGAGSCPDGRSCFGFAFSSVEEPGFAVLFGFDAVVGWAEGLVVGVGGEASVGVGVDVVALEVVAAVAAGGGADVAVEFGRCTEIQCGLEHGGVAAAEVGDGVDLGGGV